MIIEPIFPIIVGVAFAILLLGVILRQLRQPYVVGYILVGILVGNLGHLLPGVKDLLEQFGSVGIVLLLFFIGLHISLPKLVARWRVAVVGTFLQVLFSVLLMWGVTAALGWSFRQALLLGFVISLSSTAVVLKILADRKELNTKVGQNVLGILLVQDLAIIPMFIVLDILKGEAYNSTAVLLQIAGGGFIIMFVAWVKARKRFRLPFTSYIEKDNELQVFVALLLCFGLALLSGLFGLSTALGAFVAGLVVASAEATHWVQERLESFHVVFVALFFIYVGMLIDLHFFAQYWWVILLLVLAAFIANTAINTLILYFLGSSWKESLYAGGLLSQIGEFSFLLGTVGYEAGLFTDFVYQLTISIIALTLLLSPLWIVIARRMMHIDANYVFELPKRVHKAIKRQSRRALR